MHETPARRRVSRGAYQARGTYQDGIYVPEKKPWYKRIFSRSTLTFRRIIGGILMLAVIGVALVW